MKIESPLEENVLVAQTSSQLLARAIFFAPKFIPNLIVLAFISFLTLNNFHGFFGKKIIGV